MLRGPCPCCKPSEQSVAFLIHVDDPAGNWHCFRCGEQGDVLNLWRLVHEGDWRIDPHDFPGLLRRIAESVGVTVPAARMSGPAAAADLERARLDEISAAVRAHINARFRDHPEAAGPLGPDWAAWAATHPVGGRLEAGAWDDTLGAHLQSLGYSEGRRRRLGLSSAHLHAMGQGLAIVRATRRGRVAFSVYRPDGTWARTDHTTMRYPPVLLTPPPAGRGEDRILVACANPGDAMALARAAGGPDARASSLGIVLLPDAAQLDAAQVRAWTERSLVLWTSEGRPAREWYELGATLLAQGLGVRVVAPQEPPTTADALRAVVQQAPDFITWQWEHLAARGIAPGSDAARRWLQERVAPLAARISDSLLQDVVQHRAQLLATQGHLSPLVPRPHR